MVLNESIFPFDGFWGTCLNKRILLWRKEEFALATEAARKQFSEQDWLLFKSAIVSSGRHHDRSQHKKMERAALKSIHAYIKTGLKNGGTPAPSYRYEHEDARDVARTFFDACIMSPVNRGCLTLEEVEIEGRTHWICREYYDPTLIERVTGKRRLAKTFTVTPDRIELINGLSFDFAITWGGEAYRMTCEGLRKA